MTDVWETPEVSAEEPLPNLNVVGDVRNRVTDRANALDFALMVQGKLVFAPAKQSGTWLYYDERRWITDAGTVWTTRLAGELADRLWQRRRQIPEDAEGNERGLLNGRIHRVESAAGLKGMLTFAASLLAKPLSEFDTNPWLLNCPNGTFDVRTGEDVGRDPTHYITRLCPTPYDPDARDDVWEKVLKETFDGPHSEERAMFFQRWQGYNLTGDTSEKKFVVLCGPTDAGKSTVAEPFLAVLGDVGSGGYATVWGADVVQADSNVNRDEKLNKVRGARSIIVGELAKGSRMADNFVKKFTGPSATMDARGLYQDSYSLRPTAKLLMDTNYVPKSADPAVHNRLVLLPVFHVPPVKDPAIKRHLEEDPDALRAQLAWAMRGCRDWYRLKTLGETPWLEDAKRKFIRDSDPVVDFIESCCEVTENPTEWIGVDLMFTYYEPWAKLNVPVPLKARAFGNAMEERGHTKVRPEINGKKRTVFTGLRMLPLDDLPEVVRQRILGQNLPK